MAVRYFLSTFLFLIVTKLAIGQLCFPVKKVYAFFQPVTAGIMSKDEARNRQQSGNYLIYITTRSEGVKLNNVWINGALHHAELAPVTTPVSLSASKGTSIVPAMKGHTYQLKFTALANQSIQLAVPKKYASAPLVLELNYKNRIRFISVDSFKPLDTAPLY